MRSMIRPGQEGTRVAERRAEETSRCLNDPEPSIQLVSFGIHGATSAATNFFDQEGAAYFGELEEALLHGVDGIRKTEEEKSYFTGVRPPPTLEMFPSWPMRLQQNPRQGNSQSAGSTDSSSAHHNISQMESDSPASKKASSDQSAGRKQQQQQQQQMMTMADGGASRSGTATNHQLTSQEKKKMAGSTAAKDGKNLDAKTLRRLAQNREAARKSRLRKKAYVQNLETSGIRLQQLEQELQRARSQGLFVGAAGNPSGAVSSSAAATFDMEYSRWLEEDCKHAADLRGALHAHLPDGNLGLLVDECIRNYDELFQFKGVMAKTDVFHLLSGMWTTPAERCFLWMGGFRPSELLKILTPQLDPLTEQQVSEINSLQQSSYQAEEALSKGLEQLFLSLANEVATGSLTDAVDVSNYMAHMAAALGKLADIERFIREADRLRQVTLHQLRRVLTVRQAARCFLAIGEYYTRLRALSSLWASRPRENMISNDSACLAPADLQMIHQPSLQSHFTAF